MAISNYLVTQIYTSAISFLWKTFVYTIVYIYMCVYIYVYIYVYICIYTYIKYITPMYIKIISYRKINTHYLYNYIIRGKQKG